MWKPDGTVKIGYGYSVEARGGGYDVIRPDGELVENLSGNYFQRRVDVLSVARASAAVDRKFKAE